MRRICLIVFLFIQWSLSTPIFAQDTISLFYATAKFRLTDDHQQQLTNFLEWQELALLDSIQIIGVADSSGNVVSNERLSLKRATQVQSFLLNKSIVAPVSVLAKGEDPMLMTAMEKQRRVDIILFFQNSTDDPVSDQNELISQDDGFCYVVADTFLISCYKHEILKGKKRFVELQMEPRFYNPSVQLYVVSEDVQSHKPLLKPLKWKEKVTGQDWWLKKRFVVTVKKEDYDRFRVVQRSNLPCDSATCGFRLSDLTYPIEDTIVLSVDGFLMQNIQWKQRKNSRDLGIELKVPRAYIDPAKKYYIDSAQHLGIVWTVRPGKKNQPYYFAKIYLHGIPDHCFRIYANFETKCAQEIVAEPDFGWICCRQMHDSRIVYGIEFGDRNVKPTHLGYVGIYVKYHWARSEINALLGLDTDWDPFLSSRFDYHFVGLNKSGFTTKPVVYSGRHFCLYGGTTLDVVFQNAEQFMSNQDVHLGVDFTRHPWHHSFQRIYLEGGPMIQYTDLSQPIRPQFRLGIQFRL